MASPFQTGPVSDQGLQSPIYHEDYGFLQQNLMRSNQQYEAGEQKVVGDYSNIVNQATLGTEAADRKRQYIDQIQEGLKKVAPTDLSLPKNTAQAENLYSPFWKDDDLLTNIGLTKQYQNETSKLDSWENSTDKEVRSQYNDTARTYLQMKQQEVANAPLSRTAYNKLEQGKATIFYDIDGDIAKQYKEEGNKGVDNVSVIGAGDYTEHNGVKSIPAYTNYYLSKMASGKYNEQLKVSAYVAMQSDKQNLLQRNPDASPQQIDEHFAASNIAQLGKSYSDNSNNFNNLATYWDGRVKTLLAETKNGKTATQDQRDKIQFYQLQAQQHRQQASVYSDLYQGIGGGDVSSKAYQKSLKDISEHPEQYITDISKQQMADSWARGMAYINTGETITLDPTVAEYNRHSEKQAELVIQQRGVDATNYSTTAKLFEDTGETTPGGRQDPRFNSLGDTNSPKTSGWKADYTVGTGSGNSASTTPVNPFGPGGMRPEGINTTEVVKLPTDFVQQQQGKIANDITNDIYDTNGLAKSLVLSGVIKAEELPDLKEWADSAISGNRSTQGQANIIAKIKHAMKDRGMDVSNIHGPQGMQTALIDYTEKVGKDLLKTTVGDNLSQLHKQGSILVGTAAQMQQRMMLYNQNQQTYDNAENALLTTNPGYQKLAIKNPNTGQVRQVTADDIAPALPTLNLETGNDNYHFYNGEPSVLSKRYTAKEFAQDWVNGKVEISNHSTGDGRASVAINGRTYAVNNMSVEQLNHMLYGGNQGEIVNPHSPVGRFGTPEEHAALKKKASDDVNKSLDLTKNGLVYPRYGIDPSDPHTSPELIRRFAGEAASASVAPIIYADEAVPGKEIGEKETKMLRGILSNTDETKKYISHMGHVNTADGLPAIELTMTDAGTNEHATGWSHDRNKFILPVADLQNAPTLASIPIGEKSFLYNDIYKINKPVNASPIMKSYGQDYSIRGIKPDAKGNATYAYVVMRYSLPDNNNPGKFQQLEPEVYEIPLSGAKGKNSEEIVNFANDKSQQYIGKTTEMLKDIQQKSASNNEYAASVEDVKKYGK